MYFSIFLALLTWQLHMRVQQISADNEKCPYENTVNLTNHQRYENGSYLYEGLIIPPEKQQFYDYHLNLIWDKESVPLHLRGCVCEERPCLKLCCQKDEYFDYTRNTSKCKKITSDMKVAWELPLLQQSGKSEMTNIFKHFTTQVFIPCEKPEYLDPMYVEWILKEDGFLIAYDLNIDLNIFCFSPLLDSISGEYILRPYECIPSFDYTEMKFILFKYGQYVLLLFLIITVLVYLVLHELKRNLGEKIFFCYLISATIFQASHVIILNFDSFFQYSSMFLRFIGYFFYVASFSWLSILCYDIWKHFNESYVEPNSSKTLKQFIIYSRFAWLSAGLATFLFVFVELLRRVNNIFESIINSSKWPSIIFYLGPSVIVLLLNILTFIRLMAVIYKTRRDAASFTQSKQFYKKYATVIIRLFLMLGVPWFIHFLPFFTPFNAKFEFLYVLSDFFDGIQGVLVFVLFVLRRKVWNLLKERFKKSDSKAQTVRFAASEDIKMNT